MHDLFIPVGCHCVEDEPTGRDNCKRDENRARASIADAVVMKGHVCDKESRRVTRDDLEKSEAAVRLWIENANKCSLTCAKSEKTYFDSQSCEHNDPKGACVSSSEVERGCQCVCEAPNGRDGSGACVPCAHGYVKKTTEPGAATFKNGEFHCAGALNSTRALEIIV
jgi:hypothetical protein